MDKIWKAIGVLALVIAIGGAILVSTAFITGASTDRVMAGFGGAEGLRAAAEALWLELFP